MTGNPDAADNCGNYPIENMVMLDDESLAVMLMCTSCYFQSMLFDLAVTAVEERIRSRIFKVCRWFPAPDRGFEPEHSSSDITTSTFVSAEKLGGFILQQFEYIERKRQNL